MRRRARQGALAFLLLSAPLVGGCPPAKGPETVATVKDTDLPADAAKLIEYADAEYAKQTAVGAENSVRALEKAKALKPGDADILWRLARAHVWLTEEYDDDARRLAHSEAGVAAGEEAVKVAPARVEPWYYLALSRAEYVNVKKDKARPILPTLVDNAKQAVQRDEKFDQAGPLRVLGSVYAQAPEPPVSVGDHQEGIELLEKAVKLEAAHPENHLLLGDAYRVDKKIDAAEREYNTVLAMPAGGAFAHRLPKWQKQAQEGLTKLRNLRNARRNGDNNSPF